MIVTLALAVALAHLLLGVVLWLKVRKLYSYPGLLGFPVFGNLYYFYRTLFIGTMDSMEKYMIRVSETNGKDGLCFHWLYGFRRLVIVSSPHVVKEIAFHPNVTDKPNFVFGGFLPYLDGPFVCSRSDDSWKMKRKEYDAFLKKSKVDRNFNNTFNKCADQLIELMLASPSAANIYVVTLDVIHNSTMENLFGVASSTVYNSQIISIMSALPVLGSLIIANPKLAGTVLAIFKPMESIFLRKIGKMRKSILTEIYTKMLNSSPLAVNKEPLLSRQITSRIRKHNEGEDKLITELQELFMTATNTTYSVLSSSLIFLALLPDIQERAWKEQNEIFDNDNRNPSLDDLSQMNFLDRFIKESLRFVTPPFIPKLVTGDTTINGVTIPQGSHVIYLTRYMRMDSKNWKNPEVFDPDRFLEESDTLKHSYSPFGIGVRSCPGMYYATSLLKIILSKVVRRLKLRPVQKDFRFEDIQYKSCILREITNPPLLQVEERVLFSN